MKYIKLFEDIDFDDIDYEDYNDDYIYDKNFLYYLCLITGQSRISNTQFYNNFKKGHKLFYKKYNRESLVYMIIEEILDNGEVNDIEYEWLKGLNKLIIDNYDIKDRNNIFSVRTLSKFIEYSKEYKIWNADFDEMKKYFIEFLGDKVNNIISEDIDFDDIVEEEYEDIKIGSNMVILFDYTKERLIEILDILRNNNIKWITGREIDTKDKIKMNEIDNNMYNYEYTYFIIHNDFTIQYGYCNDINFIKEKHHDKKIVSY